MYLGRMTPGLRSSVYRGYFTKSAVDVFQPCFFSVFSVNGSNDANPKLHIRLSTLISKQNLPILRWLSDI